MRFLRAALAAAIGLAASGLPLMSEAEVPPPLERDVLPSATDAAIRRPDAPHFVAPPVAGVRRRNVLFVWLPGTGAQPRVYRLIVREAAKRGYHGIGLAYPSDVAVGAACANSADPACFGAVRLQILTGKGSVAGVGVDPTNSVVNRLKALLRYLAATYPAEGWEQFLSSDGEPAWPKIEFGGHSQGSGHTGYLTKLYPLARACFFSFGYDRNERIDLAPWFALPNVTPPSRMYGFINVNDEIVKYAQALREWKMMGLFAFGEPVSVDGAAPPYGGSHILTTALPPAPTTPATSRYPNHSEPIADVATPKAADGTPVHAPVWDTMCFE